MCGVARRHTSVGEKSSVSGTADFCRSNKIMIGITRNGTRFPVGVSDRVTVLIMHLFFFPFFRIYFLVFCKNNKIFNRKAKF